METRRNDMKKLLFLITFTILLLVGVQKLDVVIGVFWWLIGILKPFIIGGCIAFIINLPLRFIEKHIFHKETTKNRFLKKASRPLGILISIIFLFGIVTLVAYIIVPEIKNTAATFGETIPDFTASAQEWIDGVLDKHPEIEQYVNDKAFDWTKLNDSLLNLSKQLFGGIWTSAFGFITGLVSTLTNVLIGFVFAIYLLANKETLAEQGKKLCYSTLPEKKADRFLKVLKLTERTFSKYASGQCIEAMILGTMFFVTLTILRYPYALLIGVLVAFTALVPYFGAFVGSTIATILIFMVDPMKAIGFIVIFNVLQQFEDNVIYPRVVGSSVGLPSIWVLFAATIGGSLMGIVGMIISIPLFSVIYILVTEKVNMRLLIRRIPAEKLELGSVSISDYEKVKEKSESHRRRHKKKESEYGVK